MSFDLAKLIAASLQKYGGAIGVKPCTLIKSTPGTRNPANLTGGTLPTETSYAATGWIEDYAPRDVDGTLITEQDRKISILGASIAGGVVPADQDKVTIADPDGSVSTYVLQSVQADGVGAVYTCVGRA